jgi:hypothetical protein
MVIGGGELRIRLIDQFAAGHGVILAEVGW